MKQTTPGESLLHRRNPQLHNSREVDGVAGYLRQGGAKIPNEPVAKLGAYLEFLADPDFVNDGVLTGDKDSIRRQVEAVSVPLTKENAEAYVKFQAKVARELGRGAEVEPSRLNDEAKMNALRLVRKDQQQQLEEWIDELASDENNYPDWFKYWAFDQVKGLTVFNEDLGKNGKPKGFERRSGGSFALFPELDRASLSLVYDFLQEKLTGVPVETGHDFDYSPMRALLDEANFGKLYGEAQNYGFKITDKLKEVTTGSWHNFPRSYHAEDAEVLSTLVRSYRTGWCTAGRETAQVQLQSGNFYVWCSTNPETGNDEVPRIAVRMENGVVAEVRGVEGGKRQELEGGLTDIAMEKIKDLPGGAEYFKKAEDMKRLTALDNKIHANPEAELSKSEIRFLYELDSSIEGFGYAKDPRVAELRAKCDERDYGEMRPALLDVLMEQARAAYGVYRDMSRQLGAAEIMTEASFAGLLELKEAEWREDGVIDYLVNELIEKGSRPNLVATPNVLADWEQIRALGVEFGDDQPSRTYTDDAFLSQYSAEEVSGLLGDDPVRLSIISSAYSLDDGDVEEQRQQLDTLQKEQPALNYRVPSMLDAVMYWHTLRARGVGMDLGSTFIRHFDVPVRRVGYVPGSFVLDDGGAGLDSYYAYNLDPGRLSVG